MNSSPDDFKDLRRLLALKRHEQPPPGYFSYLPNQVLVKIEKGDLSEHSTWWEWLVARFDARPVLAGAYAFAISGLMLLGVKVSRDFQSPSAGPNLFPGFAAEGPHPLNINPSPRLRGIFANPVELINFSSTEFVYEEPAVIFPPSTTTTTFVGESAMFAH